MGWEDPSESDFFEIKQFVGCLALIAVNEYLPNFVTSMGASPAVRAEVAIIDGPQAGKRFVDALFFGKKIVPQLRNSVGSTVLGRVVKGEAKAGQSAPYQLQKATAEDGQAANAYVKAHGDVDSKPVDTSMASPQGYAPDNEQWRVQQAQQQQAPQQASQHPQLIQHQGYPPPPPMPSTYTAPAAVGADDQPPF